MEYSSLAVFYDLFYKNKKYSNEVKFLIDLIGDRTNILDVGCGTGIHMSLLENEGYKVDGLDLNEEMLAVAKTRVNGNLYNNNLLDFKLENKYDAIISMFAVFNHLKSYEEFEIGIINLIKHLNDNGIIIIDLHNGKKSGEKTDEIYSLKRNMKWEFFKETNTEVKNITYIINNLEYTTGHKFIIFDLEKIKAIINKLNVEYEFLENYSNETANNSSKNIQILIKKHFLGVLK